jgi:hypothetical protein
MVMKVYQRYFVIVLVFPASMQDMGTDKIDKRERGGRPKGGVQKEENKREKKLEKVSNISREYLFLLMSIFFLKKNKVIFFLGNNKTKNPTLLPIPISTTLMLSKIARQKYSF